jgi:transcriptional regulator with PAS, ATPase and Fis domain
VPVQSTRRLDVSLAGQRWLAFARPATDKSRSVDVVDELLGQSARIVALREQIRALLTREAEVRRLPPILITGETRTARAWSPASSIAGARSKAEFVEVNGAAIPDQLLESELFGYEPGAYTDVKQRKAGSCKWRIAAYSFSTR